MKSILDLDLTGKRVLVRVDFNVPMDELGNITDDIRIRTALPTLQHIVKEGENSLSAHTWEDRKAKG